MRALSLAWIPLVASAISLVLSLSQASSTGSNERIEVIEDMTLTLAPVDEGAGTYDTTLTATRVVGSDPLVGRFRFTIALEDLDVLDDVPERYLVYPVAAYD